MWKYVDDTTLSEKVPKGQQSRTQEAVDHVCNWSAENFFQLNLEKTKELTISFCRSPEHFDPVKVDGTQIQATTSNKLLGLIINNTLTWNDHVDSLIKKAAGKIYFLVQLTRARVLLPTTAHVLDLPLITLVQFSIILSIYSGS